MKTSNRLHQIPEYIHARLNQEVKKIETQTGRKVLNFGQGSPDFRTSKKYLDKLNEFIQQPKSHVYPGYTASKEFSDALVFWYKKRFNVEINSEEVLPLLGAKDGITHFPLAFLDEGDEVLIPDPGYPAYNEPVTLIGAKPVPYLLLEEDNFKLSIDQIKHRVTKKTKAIWVNFPSNPTGQVATLDELIPIIKFAKEKNILVLYDNAYSEISFDSFSAPSIFQVDLAKDVALEFNSFSKSCSFAGFRMGWVVGSKENVDAIAKVKTQIDSGMSLPLQQLGAYALTHQDEEWNKDMLESYKSRRDIIAKHLMSLGLKFSIPKAALYIWAKIPDTEKNSEKYCMRMLNEKMILFTPGSAFGKNGDRFVRVSICVNVDEIDRYF
ncbi:MAG TPA: aminotransferase class I/II-fold pyridoxal phosphate-dependent enzyme [Candidatus Saccharimonadales bacterium]|nr:aminotransferase class I/II-fold pyridoxal phosphate-dependent enzyme [Candidatus Saccharimonadales bacterium]